MNKSLNPDDEKAHRVAYLIAGFIRRTLTPAEHDELDKWIEESDENLLLFEELTDEKNIEEGLAGMEGAENDFAYQNIRGKIPFERKTKKIWPYAIAAAILLTAAGIYFFKNFRKTDNAHDVVQQPVKDLAPGGNKAILILSDGSAIILDSSKNGALAIQGNTRIIKNDSSLSYNSAEDVGIKQEPVFNTVTTPKGGQFQIILADGTRVWLNAASSLRFPSAFIDSAREVNLQGEAYFEVAMDSKRAFHVKTNGQDIEVQGTDFNVNGYNDETNVKTTLLEGSVIVKTASSNIKLKPGEQSLVTRDGKISVNKNIETEAAVAWKEGMFHFKYATIKEILSQVSRWYDAEIVYEGNINDHFNITISRKLPVSKLFSRLEKTGRVHFKIDGKKIVVTP